MLPAVIPEMIPTLDDLKEIFPKLPPPDKWKEESIVIPVQASTQEWATKGGLFVQHTAGPKTVGTITFWKMVDNNTTIWIYKGIVKYRYT